MKLLAGIIVAFGSFFLIFHTKVVDFVAAPDFSRNVEAEKNEKEPINIIFVGDVMLGRAVEIAYKQEDIFKNVANIFNEADAVVANLEGPILSNHIKTPNNSYKFSFATTTLDILKYAGFTDLSLANNHTDNSGRSGYAETVLNLKSVGINSFGDPNLISEDSIDVREVNGKKFVFAGVNDTYGNLTVKQILEFSKNLRSKFIDSFLIVFMHWGEEYEPIANERQIEIGRGLIDSGVDVVVGSHPHVIQNLEKYNGKYIFYSLGNFVFDQYFSTSTQQGLAIKMKIGEAGSEFELFPVISNRSVPVFLSGEGRDSWLGEYMETNEISKLEILDNILK